MRVCCCQFDIAWEDKPANHARVAALLDEAKLEGGSLVLLPEMFATGFSMDVARIAEDAQGPTHQFLAETSRRLGVWVVAGVVTRGADGMGRNEAVVFSAEGKEVARYCKMHPFSYGKEAGHYGRGEGPVAFEWGGMRVSPFVCYDLRFPEVFRAAVMGGAQLLCVIANWPSARESHWVTLLRARAIENQAYVAAVNRCGNEPKIGYSGRSMVIDPRGEIVVDAGDGEKVIGAEVDVGEVTRYRAEFPALKDVHPAFGRGICDTQR